MSTATYKPLQSKSYDVYYVYRTLKKEKNMKRPRRKKKADALLHGQIAEDEIRCDYAVAPLDNIANEMDRKWGIDRLPELVSPATAEKYGAAIAHLNTCMANNDPPAAAAAAQNCIKGMKFMDAEAEANNAPKAKGMIFEIEIEAGADGGEPFRMAVLENEREWQTAKDNRPDLTVFTQREVAIAMQFYVENKLIIETKKHFPKARITNIKADPPVDYKNGGDPIPF